jgi:2'-5' RNA ligase
LPPGTTCQWIELQIADWAICNLQSAIVMETYRLFIAVEVSAAAKAELVGVQQRLLRFKGLTKWVAPEAMHLTLHFLGETSAAFVPQLGTALSSALTGHRAFELCLDCAGAFPNLRRPEVVWVGVGGDRSALSRIHAALGAALNEQSLPSETRPFRPHLTIGRVRRDGSPAQLAQLGVAIQELPPLAPVSWLAERVVLFRSQLRPNGPVYTEILDCIL